MKRKRSIYALLLTLLLIACEKEVLVEVPVYIEKESNVSFTLYTTTFATKGMQDHYGTAPLEEERRIFNYALLIFNATSGQLEATLAATPYDPTNPESTGMDVDPNAALYFTDEEGNELVVTLTSGSKKIFGLVNAPQPVWDKWMHMMQEEKATLDDYRKEIIDVSDKGGISYITGTSKTPAGDERGFLMTTSDEPETIYLEPTDENILPIKVVVGRGMAKVSVASDLKTNPRDIEQQPNGTLSHIYYKVINNPDKTFVIPSITNNYLYTPYFHSQSQGEVNRDLYFESPGIEEGNYVHISRKGELTQLYCMENGNENPNNKNATLVVIKGTYTPDILYRANGEDFFEGYHTGMDFWRVIEMEGEQRGNYLDKYYGENPAAYITENQRIVQYRKGITYYFLPLDREETNIFPYPHNHTVKRNSYYNIDITKVNNAGDEDENPGTDLPGPDPGPEPTDLPQITVTITIKDWDLIQSSSEL